MAEGKKVIPETEYIRLNVHGHELTGVEVFTVKKDEPLREIMDLFCERVGWPRDLVNFFYDCLVVYGNDTPNNFGMEDNDTIEAGQWSV